MKKFVNWCKNNSVSIVIGVLCIIIGTFIGVMVTRLGNIEFGSCADWFSAIGTIAAVIVALWPNIEKWKPSQLLFQLEEEEEEKENKKLVQSRNYLKLNIQNFTNNTEIVYLPDIDMKVIYFYLWNEKGSCFFKDTNYNEIKQFCIKKFSDDKLRIKYNPVIINGMGKVTDVNKDYLLKNEAGKSTGNNYYNYNSKIILLISHSKVARNNDNYVFYSVILSLDNDMHIVYSETLKNIDEKELYNKIDKVLLNVTPNNIKNAFGL